MAVIAPERPNTVRKAIRLSDARVSRIDHFSMELYASRADFIVAAMREFAERILMLTAEKMDEVGEGDPRTVFLKTNHRVSAWIDVYCRDAAMMDDGTVTSIMLHVPGALLGRIEYLRIQFPVLKNFTVFVRASIGYKFETMMRESLSTERYTRLLMAVAGTDSSSDIQDIAMVHDVLVKTGEIAEKDILDGGTISPKNDQAP